MIDLRIDGQSPPRPGPGSALAIDGPGEAGLVSVVIPSYNRGYIIGTAIESVLAGSHRPVEVIVVDDGSSDDTRAVVERYGDPVRYVRQANAGVAAARNTGLRAARGEFVALLDSDDRFVPWKLAAQVALLRRYPELGMVWTDMTAVRDDGAIVEERHLRTFYGIDDARIASMFGAPRATLGMVDPSVPATAAAAAFYAGDAFSYMLLGNHVHTSTVMIRRERLRRMDIGFDVDLRPAGEDYDFHLRTCAVGPVGFLDAPTVRYRVGVPDQLTSPQYGRSFARHNLRTVIRTLASDGDRIHLPDAVLRRRLAHAFGWYGEEEALYGERRAAVRNLWRSLRLDPRQPRKALLLLLSLFPRPVLVGARAVKRRLRESGLGRPHRLHPA
jgi:glycosyltransferase involved in cell wall biosynthesis